jgi:hypothetical protein
MLICLKKRVWQQQKNLKTLIFLSVPHTIMGVFGGGGRDRNVEVWMPVDHRNSCIHIIDTDTDVFILPINLILADIHISY